MKKFDQFTAEDRIEVSGLRINIGINIMPYNKTATMLLNFERETI